ncbi:hypothetical protein NG798_26140 [Ancylothrix sp. C2]|uniref:hypothetical protein n=1 Tax=Ancylothrix sp. D3o TaxID=2953691 RepID=UPI0021BAB719|nr:hypothetical protein [Ancylothrix sp. D3o]MCT7953284.1 hypothetical protein [Ancylothrix sp. D3o]
MMPRTKSSRNKNVEPSLNSEEFQPISTTLSPTEISDPLAETTESVEAVQHDVAETKMFEPVSLVESQEDSDTSPLPPQLVAVEVDKFISESCREVLPESLYGVVEVPNSADLLQSNSLEKSDSVEYGSAKPHPDKKSPKKRIHFWGGESGGVGKSTGCKAMIHYLDATLGRQDFRLIDADRSKPDVKDAYSTALGERCLEGFFSEATDLFSKADEILNAALYGDVVVNLPASVGAALEQWVKNTDLILVAAESNIELIVWFVSNGSPDSMRLFYESLQQWGAGVNHVLVRNLGLNRNSEVWEKFAASDEYQKAKQQHGFKEFDLPMLYDAGKISGATVPLQNFAANPQLLGIAGASRTRKFLKDVSASFDATGLFERPSVTS